MADENKLIIEIEMDDGSIKKGFVSLGKAAKETGDQVEKSIGKGAEKGAGKLTEALSEINPQLAGIVSKFSSLAPIIAGVAAAVGSVKAVFDSTFEAERLDTVNRQFDLLSRNAGISGIALRESFEEAANGLVSTDDLLKAATESIALMGRNAEQLGPIFEIAMKTASITGGDAIQSFNILSQAIATQNTRALKSIGLFIDSKKALEAYAAEHGVLVKNLTESEQQLAIMEAIQKKANTALAGVDPEAAKATAAYQRMKVALQDLSENTAKAIGQSELFQGLFNGISEAASRASTTLTAKLGSGVEQLQAKVVILEEALRKEKQTFSEMASDDLLFAAQKKTIVDLEQRIRDLTSLIGEQQRKLQSQQPGAANVPVQVAPETNAATEEQLLAAEQFNAKLAEIQRKGIEERMAITTDEGVRKQLQAESEWLRQVEFAARIAELDAQFKATDLANTQLHEDAKKEMIDRFNREALERQTLQGAGFVGRMRLTSKQLQDGLQQSIGTSIKYMANQLAQGKFNFEDFAKTILGTLGDAAINIGAMAIASGIAMESIGNLTGTKAAIAGAALIGIGIIMKALSGGAGSSAPSGGGGPTPSFGTDQTSMPGEQPEPEVLKPATNININVQGNILDRRQTGLELAEIINESFSANGTLITTGSIA